MNKLVRNTLVLLFSTICSISNSSSVNNKKTNLNLIDCGSCVHDESDIHHEHDSLEIINLPTTLSFGVNTLSTDDNYGTYKVQANYQPVGCLTDTIWTSSNSDVIRIDVDSSDSSIATLVCLQPFEGEITITATSKYFTDISFSCTATYKESFEITPLEDVIELTGSNYRTCPGLSYSFSYDNKVLLSSLYTMNEDVSVSYEISGTGVVIDGNYIRMNSAVESSTYSLKIIPEGYEDLAISIPIDCSYTSSSGSHLYSKTLYKSAYVGTTEYYEDWSDWETTKTATCSKTGEKERRRKVYVYSYTNEYKHTCKYCGDYYYSGGTRSKKYLDDDVETEIIPKDFTKHSYRPVTTEYYCNACGYKMTYSNGTYVCNTAPCYGNGYLDVWNVQECYACGYIKKVSIKQSHVEC